MHVLDVMRRAVANFKHWDADEDERFPVVWSRRRRGRPRLERGIPYVPVFTPLSPSQLTFTAAEPTLFQKEFSLGDRVALVTGANRGLGLEMAMTLVEAGCRAVYCVDLPQSPGEEFTKVKQYVENMKGINGRMEYISADVRDQVHPFSAAISVVRQPC